MKLEQFAVHDNTAGDENISLLDSKAHNFLLLCLAYQLTEQGKRKPRPPKL